MDRWDPLTFSPKIHNSLCGSDSHKSAYPIKLLEIVLWRYRTESVKETMMGTSSIVVRFALLLSSIVHTWGFKWPIHSVYDYGKGKFTFSEVIRPLIATSVCSKFLCFFDNMSFYFVSLLSFILCFYKYMRSNYLVALKT